MVVGDFYIEVIKLIVPFNMGTVLIIIVSVVDE